MISHQLRPSNQPITKNHHLQTQFEGLTIKSDPQVGRQTLNKFDYPLFIGPECGYTASGNYYLNSQINFTFFEGGLLQRN